MPPPSKISINSKSYVVPILSGEMDNIANEIIANKEELRSLRNHITDATNNLTNNSNALLLLYIQQTGQYPPQS